MNSNIKFVQQKLNNIHNEAMELKEFGEKSQSTSISEMTKLFNDLNSVLERIDLTFDPRI